MNLYLLILFLIFSSYKTAYSQLEDAINFDQKSERDNKIGKWIEYFDNGNIKEVRFYEEVQSVQSKEEAFFKGIPIDTNKIEYYSKLMWKEVYEYHENWDFKRIKRIEKGKNPFYLYGLGKEIKIVSKEFYFTGKVDDIKNFTIRLTNNSNHNISLYLNFSSDIFSSKSYKTNLPAMQVSDLEINFQIEANTNDYKIKLHNDSIIIDFSVKTFGYHLESKDIEWGKKLIFSDNEIYHRTGNETLLKILSENKKELFKMLSITGNYTYLDLQGIEPGDYTGCIYDFSLNKEVCTQIQIK